MKLKPNFELRDVCGEQVVIPCGIENVNFDSIIHLNETGAFLWREAEKGDFSVESAKVLAVPQWCSLSTKNPKHHGSSNCLR